MKNWSSFDSFDDANIKKNISFDSFHNTGLKKILATDLSFTLS